VAEDLILSGLKKTYTRRGKPDVPAVKGIDLKVSEAELLALLGPSGCGKSSTLRMIAGLEDVTDGDILIGGRSVVGLPPHKRNIALAFESYALYPPLTVEENITFGMQARKESNPKKRAREIAERLGITDILGQKPGSLSSGQKQRVSLARAIVRHPALLLLDEPLSHLDLSGRTQTRREIKHLQTETGYTTVLVTHDQLEALSMADRIALMNEGEIQQVGTPEEVYDDPANLFVAGFIGDTPMNLLPGRAIRQNGSTHVELSKETVVSLNGTDAAPIRDVVVGVRPDDIRVVDTDSPGVLTGTVFAHELLQESGFLSVRLPGVEDRVGVSTLPEARFGRGKPVGLSLDPGRTHLFDAGTGERIG
jgi:multiple sugar transport system ATP-binding protein